MIILYEDMNNIEIKIKLLIIYDKYYIYNIYMKIYI